jgi:hypothetical protein
MRVPGALRRISSATVQVGDGASPSHDCVGLLTQGRGLVGQGTQVVDGRRRGADLRREPAGGDGERGDPDRDDEDRKDPERADGSRA